MTGTRPFAPRWARLALYVVVGLVVLVALLLVALRTSFAREQIRSQVNSGLSEVFQGRLQIDRISRVTLGGVGGVDARVFDADGKQVARVQGLNVEASLLGLGWQLLTNSDQPELVLALVQVDHADVTLRDDEELGVSIARAFLPRTPSVEPPNAPPSGPHLHLQSVHVRHVWGSWPARHFAGARRRARAARGVVGSVAARRLQLGSEARRFGHARLARGAQPSGKLSGKIVAPADVARPLRLEGKLTGRAAGSPLALDASWVGDDLRASVDLPELPATFVNDQVPSLRLTGNVAVHAEVNGDLPVLAFAATVDGAAAHVDVDGYAAISEGLEAP